MAEVNFGRTHLRGNRLVPYLVRHCFAGMLAGWTAVGALLLLDVGGLGGLIFGAEAWLLALAMLLAFFGLTFGSVAMGAAIMSLGRAEPRGPAAARSAATRSAERAGEAARTISAGRSSTAIKRAPRLGEVRRRCIPDVAVRTPRRPLPAVCPLDLLRGDG
jgi:hypothetical protein